MTPERLAELQRQRDVIREHLAWLEREIAGATTGAASSAAATMRSEAAPQPPVSDRSSRVVPPDARGLAPAPEFATRLAEDTAVDHYRPDPTSVALAARRGCVLTFGLALLLLAIAFAAVYLLWYRDRPLLFTTPADPAAEKLAAPPSSPSPQK